LHGYFYGTEPLADLAEAKSLFTAETNRLFTTPGVRPLIIDDVVNSRYSCFTNRLHEALLTLKTNGQPEIPRLVGHTLRLLNVLSNCAAITPAALDITPDSNSQTNITMRLAIYGEPYAHYILQTCTSFTGSNPVVANMTDLIATNHNEDVITTTNRTGLYRIGRRPIP
jgi:hypothetical protein